MKFNKLFMMSGLALASFMLFSCSEDDNYTPGGTVGTDSVTFVNEQNYALALEDTQFSITVHRSNSQGAQTIPLEVIQKGDVLTVPSSVSFEDGESDKDVVITVSDAAKPFVDYPLVISIPAQYAGTTYTEGASSYPRLQVTVHKEDFRQIGTLLYQSWLFDDTWESDLYYSEYLGTYRCDIFTDGYPIYFKANEEEGTLTFVNVDGVVQTDNQIGYNHPSYGLMFTRWNSDAGVIFQDGAFYFVVQYRVSAGSFGENYDALMIQKAE